MGQNAWQRAQQQKTDGAQLTTVNEMYNQMIKTMCQEVTSHKSSVIEAFVKEALGVAVLLDMAEIKRRGFLAPSADGSEVFHWDNAPRIYFSPVDLVQQGETMRPVLKWKRIPLIAEPDFTGASEEFLKYLALARGNNWHIPVSDPYKESAWLAFWKECEEDQARISALKDEIGAAAATDDSEEMLNYQADRAKELHGRDETLGGDE